jgi:hypothetical protein
MAVASVAAAGMSAYGQYQQGKAADYQADYEAKVAENNAKVADYQAQDAARRGELEAQQIQRAYAARIAAGRTGFAAGNVALDSGSAGLWQVGNEEGRAEDLATSKTNTALDIWGIKYQGTNLRAQAGALRIGGANARAGANIGAAGSLLQGASSAAGAYYMYASRVPSTVSSQPMGPASTSTAAAAPRSVWAYTG